MKIILVEKIITSNYLDEIVRIDKKNIGCYFSDHLPRVGEIIWFTNNNYYDVCQVIHTMHSEVILEVITHSNSRVYGHKTPLYQEVPLVTQIESNSWLPKKKAK